MKLILSLSLGLLSSLVFATKSDSSCVQFEEQLYLNLFLNQKSSFDLTQSSSKCELPQADLLLKEGKFHLQQTNYEEALKAFEQLMQLNSGTEANEATYYYGKTLYEMGQFQEAISYLEQCENGTYYGTLADFKIAQSFYKLNQLQNSNLYYGLVINADPKMDAAWNNLAFNFEKLGDYKNSLRYYRIADSLVSQEDPLYRSNIISALRHNQEYLKALTYAEEAKNDFPDYYRIIDQYATVYNHMGQHYKAVEITKDYLKKHPYEQEALFRIAYSYGKAGKTDSALVYYYKDLMVNSNRQGTLHNLGRLYRILGEFDLSIKFIKRSLELDSSFEKSLHSMVNLYIWKHEFDSAYQAINQFYKFTVNAESEHNFMGYSLLLIKKYKEAIDHFEQAIAYDSIDSKSFNNMARCYAKLGRYETADSLFKIALKRDSTNSFIFHNRASMLYDIGDYEAACENLSKAIELEYNWIIDSTLYSLRDEHCTEIELDREILFHGYKGNLDELEGKRFIALIEDSERKLQLSDSSENKHRVDVEKKSANKATKEFGGLKLYPNPSQGRITVEFNYEITTLKVFDMNGSMILEKIVSGKQSVPINLQDENPGTYLLIGSNENEVKFSSRIIISR